MHITKQPGFTLVEMAVVLTIVALLLGGLLMPFSMQMEQRQYAQTQKTLEEAKEALIGFAMANGRLPCPATAASNGVESFNVGAGGTPANGICATFYGGFLPSATLGISALDANGFALDGFGGVPANRIRYAVWGGDNDGDGNEDPILPAGLITDIFTRSNGIKTAGMANIVNAAANPFIYICAAAPAAGAAPFQNCGGAGNQLTNSVAFVIYSVGKNSALPTSGIGADEIINSNPNSPNANNDDVVFVSHPPTPLGAANGEFDDILLWVPTSTLVSKLVSAGQLP